MLFIQSEYHFVLDFEFQNLIHVCKYWSKRAAVGNQHLELVEPCCAVHLRASAAVSANINVAKYFDSQLTD